MTQPLDPELAVALDVLLERYSPPKPYRYEWEVRAREARRPMTDDEFRVYLMAHLPEEEVSRPWVADGEEVVVALVGPHGERAELVRHRDEMRHLIAGDLYDPLNTVELWRLFEARPWEMLFEAFAQWRRAVVMDYWMRQGRLMLPGPSAGDMDLRINAAGDFEVDGSGDHMVAAIAYALGKPRLTVAASGPPPPFAVRITAE